MKFEERIKLLGLFFILTNYVFVNADDCVTFKNDSTICCKVRLESENYFINNTVYLYDTLKVDLNDVKKIIIDKKTFIRVKNGNMLSKFAELELDGNLKLYVKKDQFQSANAHFYNAKSKYFSITGDDSLHYYSLNNLIKYFPIETTAREYLNQANVKRWISNGIRACSVIPFYIGIQHAVNKDDKLQLIPFGIGISMLIVPAFTFSPAIQKDLKKAISLFNEEKN